MVTDVGLLVPVLDAHHSETLQKRLQLLMDGQ